MVGMSDPAFFSRVFMRNPISPQLQAAPRAIAQRIARHRGATALAGGMVASAVVGTAIAAQAGQAGYAIGAVALSLSLGGAGYVGQMWHAARQRARAADDALVALIENVRDAVVRFDATGNAVFLSRSAEKLFGCRRFELDGTGVFERVHVADRPAYLKALSDAGKSGHASLVDVRMRRDASHPGDSAGYVWVEMSLAPAGEGEGVAVLRDVSARKDAESTMAKARNDAEAASEAKSRFLATIGHELRTPLNAIVGFSDMMQAGIGGTLSPGHHEYAGLIKQSGHHLLEVVNMLLDISKIEAGKFELAPELFAPAHLAEPCLQLIEHAAREKSITLARAIPAHLPQLVGDERACRQILINLLSNAVKFSNDGGTITLSMKRQGKMLNISVSDTGIGMGAETVRRIGEPFFQAQGGLSRRYEGTGLGLSIVKGLVELHEGRLHVTSEAGSGTTVTVLLPLDGPAHAHRPTADIAVLHKDNTNRHESTWPERERKSAAL